MGDDVAAEEEGPLNLTGAPDRAGRADGGEGASARVSRGQRWLARLAFAAAASAVVVLLVSGALRSITALLLGFAGLVIACAAAWWFLANRGVLRWLALAVLVAAPVFVIVVYVVAGLLWEVALSVVLAAAAAAAGRAALSRGLLPDRPREHAAARPQRPFVIMNPRSGGGKVAKFRLDDKAAALGAEVALLEGPGIVDVAALARHAVDSGADLLGVAGGDGTQALVAGIAAGRDVPMMVISAGTRNHFALDLGLDRDDPAACLDSLTDGVELRIDLGLIGDRTFVNNASFGAYAQVVQSPAYRDEKTGTALAMLPDLLTGHQGAHLVVRADGRMILDGPQAVLVSNNPYETGDIAGLGRRAQLDQGVLGVVGVKIENAAQAAGLLRTAQRSRYLTMLTAREVIIDADQPQIPVGIDGESVLMPTRCAARSVRSRCGCRSPAVGPASPHRGRNWTGHGYAARPSRRRGPQAAADQQPDGATRAGSAVCAARHIWPEDPREDPVSASDAAIVAAIVFVWGTLSARLERFDVTAPILFVIVGLLLTHGLLAPLGFAPSRELVKALAEITLVLVLFSDASRVRLRDLRTDSGLCLRLLGIGLPLTIGLGTLLALALFHGMSIWLALLVGAALSPTDAALGAGVMVNPAVPARIRRLLNVESGLNDGIATPVVLVAIAGAATAEHAASVGPGEAVAELALGVLVGAVVGGAGGFAVNVARRRGWAAGGFAGSAVLALAICAYACALALHGNGFIAAFVGGLAYGAAGGKRGERLVPYVEETGALVSLLVWLAFGAIAVVPAFESLTWQTVLYAVLSLTLIRMAPVALSLIGAGLGRAAVAFVGWFGPRGLASVVFALLALEDLGKAAGAAVSVIAFTVLLSVVAHGLTADPLAHRYGPRLSITAGEPDDAGMQHPPARRLIRRAS